MRSDRLRQVGPWKESNVYPLFGHTLPEPEKTSQETLVRKPLLRQRMGLTSGSESVQSPDELLDEIDRRLDALIDRLDAQLEALDG